MKENVSIIFAAIIGTFLIVILPLYSILDRQDSMAYNVVLTATTNFVDNVRNKGFIDKESYTNYIREISTTGNTYKVKIEAYKNVLIQETDENGNVIPNSFVEEKELYNTQDILKIIENEEKNNIDIGQSNKKNNIYLFNENDEIYVKVYNTNITSGSVIYSVIANISNMKVIDISYGGVINKVNWELYEKIQTDSATAPEVVMAVPVNSKNSTNIQKLSETIDEGEYFEEYEEGQNYVYLYDLSKVENKTIKVAVELRNFTSIHIGEDKEGADIFKPLSELTNEILEDDSKGMSPEQYIIQNYIRLDGMVGNINLKLRKQQDYYAFDIEITNVIMTTLDYISTKARIVILAGLGQDENETLSLSGESVELELMDETMVNTVVISRPCIWSKLLRTKSLDQSVITDNIVYAKEEIAFVISYTGINNKSDDEVKKAIENNLNIYISDASYSELEYYTAYELNEEYAINIGTVSAGHIIVKFKYDSENLSNENYINLEEGWIQTSEETLIDPETGEEIEVVAKGASSVKYQVLSDIAAPIKPMISLEGTLGGTEGWYTSDVILTLIPSKNDLIIKNGIEQVGGSGVEKSTVTITGDIKQTETEETPLTLTTDGISYIVPKAYDYVGNVVTGDKQQVKIDKVQPTEPKIQIVSGQQGSNEWYTSDVKIRIIPGTDGTSGVLKTTYKIEGANAISEREGTSYTLTKTGYSVVTATTYDKAGNSSSTELHINIEQKDETDIPDARIDVVTGEKNDVNNKWYVTNVKLRATLDVGEAISGLGESEYEITGDDAKPLTKVQGNTLDIDLTKNGTHNIVIYTKTGAGNTKVTTYLVQIDKNAPKVPSLNIVQSDDLKLGENDWYISNVALQVTANGDIGPSGEQMPMYYAALKDQETEEILREINNNGKIYLNDDGEYKIKVYTQDGALNRSNTEELPIKIDKTPPTAADFIVKGDKKITNSQWYTSDVTISYEGEKDDTSGIQSVQLSHSSITEDTTGTDVILITKDNAGHTVTKNVNIKLDKEAPTTPQIKLDAPTGSGIFGASLYNKNVNVTITPGIDLVSEVAKTTYEVTTQGGRSVIAETEGTSFTVTEEGTLTITARTYDNAGNVSETSQVIWINKTKPAVPKIISINDTDVEGIANVNITSKLNKINLVVSNLEENNTVRVKLVNLTTNETQEMSIAVVENKNIEIGLTSEGIYSITVIQRNVYGSESASQGIYNYEYTTKQLEDNESEIESENKNENENTEETN